MGGCRGGEVKESPREGGGYQAFRIRTKECGRAGGSDAGLVLLNSFCSLCFRKRMDALRVQLIH